MYSLGDNIGGGGGRGVVVWSLITGCSTGGLEQGVEVGHPVGLEVLSNP